MLGAASLSSLLPLEAKATDIKYLPSSLDERQLEAQKMKAVNELINGFWPHPEVRTHVMRSLLGGARNQAEARQRLRDESRMYIPNAEKYENVLNRNRAQLAELSKQIPEKKFGLLLDGDEQRFYLLNKIGEGRVQFVKAYPVSTSKGGWSNFSDSRGTPLGFHQIAAGYKGILGEVVSSPTRSIRDFVQIPVRDRGVTRKRTFVKSFTSPGDANAEIVTASLLIVGPETRSTRGIYIHGTNRTDYLAQPASSGCIRMSNVDVWDLLNYVKVGRLKSDEVSAPGGTPVMINATRNIMEKEDVYPTRWQPPIESSEPTNPAGPTEPQIQEVPKKSKRPPRWIPPEE